MPNTQSQLEIERNQQRLADRQNGRLRKVIAIARGMVEHALSLNLKASRIEKQLQDHDTDTDGFRARVRADRRDWLLLWVFWSTILLYTVLEFMTSGDIAEMLACQMAPHFGIDPTTGAMPIWLRRAAGVGFVLGMLGVTLLVKLITSGLLNVLHSARAALASGEEGRHRSLTCGIWGIYLSKVAYVAAVAGLYIWLFGFAQQRAAFMADLAAEQKQTAAWTDLGVKIEGGVVETNEAAPAKSQASTETETVARLAGATGVFYAVIVLLHACVLLLPAKGFTRELELAHFKKGAAERQAVALRAEEHRTLREIYEHVRIAPEQYRSDLVEATEPVHAAINQLYKRRVIGIAGVESTPPDSNGTSSADRSQPLDPFGPNGNGGAHATNGHSHVATGPASINGSNGQHSISEEEPPVADWDAIFPSGHRA